MRQSGGVTGTTADHWWRLVPSDMPERLRRYAPAARFVVVGGATEASISSTLFEADHSVVTCDAYLPLGRPLANQRAYVLDPSMMPVPIGVPGELHLAGKGLAREYLYMPEATAEKFVRWKFGDQPWQRLYRTGDVVYLRDDGVIVMLGRKDFQLKIAGRRIELGEIESALCGHPDVKQAS